jgi:hypothetical protein
MRLEIFSYEMKMIKAYWNEPRTHDHPNETRKGIAPAMQSTW